MKEELIGTYRVHPVANLFPLLQGEEFDKFKASIRARGQLEPIVVQGDLLLDGRNRLRACIEEEIEPKVSEFGEGDYSTVMRYIVAVNIRRRHLTPDQRVSIHSQAMKMALAARNLEIQKQANIEGGKEGGRGHKKTSDMNSYPRFNELINSEADSSPRYSAKPAKPKTRAKNERSTAGQIAQLTGTSQHKAAQAIKLMNKAPELLEQVANGKLKLNKAVKQIEPSNPVKTKRPRRRFDLDRAATRISKIIIRWIEECPSQQREEFKFRILKECKQLCHTSI